MSYLNGYCLALVVMTAVFAGFPLGKASPKSDVLLGIAPGDSVSDVRHKLGDPLLVRVSPDGSQVSWNRSPAQDAYLVLGERAGVVTSVRVVSATVGIVNGVTDPFGVPLGGDQLGLRTLRGKPQTVTSVGGDQVRGYPGTGALQWRYAIRGDEVHAITLTTASDLAAANPMPKTVGSAPTLPPSKLTDWRDGSALGKALVLGANDEDEGTRFEQFFIKTLPGCGQSWSIDQRARVSDHRHHYDKMELACGDTGNTRLVYFDITAFFGKVVLPTDVP
jgi:hypothetical protein